MRLRLPALLLLPLLALAGCSLPGKPKPGPEVVRPQSILDFHHLYTQNCSGCHGANGKEGAAIALNNPLYLSIVSDGDLRQIIAHGGPGKLSPGFSAASGEGLLTTPQIEALVRGLRSAWGNPQSVAGLNPPPYTPTSPGNPSAGPAVYTAACARCHGPLGGKPGPAGNILGRDFLTLMPPQTLRAILIAGRADLGQPDWRNDIPGQPLTDTQITDLVAWMANLRPSAPGSPYPVAPQPGQ